MASPSSPDPPLPPVTLDPLAAFLSYLIPGLGQVYQGRVGKGVLFFCGLYLLFFYGMWMGQWKNVWLPDASGLPAGPFGLEGAPKALSYRPQFLGQFWIGVAAWPGVYQYMVYDPLRAEGPVFGTFQRAPSEEELNMLQRNGNKRWDLGWVFTVIAGVLNLLVIYDALAGPLFRDPPTDTASGEKANPVATPAQQNPQPLARSSPSAPMPLPLPPPAPTLNQQGGA